MTQVHRWGSRASGTQGTSPAASSYEPDRPRSLDYLEGMVNEDLMARNRALEALRADGRGGWEADRELVAIKNLLSKRKCGAAVRRRVISLERSAELAELRDERPSFPIGFGIAPGGASRADALALADYYEEYDTFEAAVAGAEAALTRLQRELDTEIAEGRAARGDLWPVASVFRAPRGNVYEPGGVWEHLSAWVMADEEMAPLGEGLPRGESA